MPAPVAGASPVEKYSASDIARVATLWSGAPEGVKSAPEGVKTAPEGVAGNRRNRRNRRRLVRRGCGRFVSVAAAPLYFFLCGHIIYSLLLIVPGAFRSVLCSSIVIPDCESGS
eukprot:1194734-Prorocentrum_minimum.AAC.2